MADDNDFTICGFKSPQKVQWMNGRGNPLTLSDILNILNMNSTPRILEIAVSWNDGYQTTTILNVTKDIDHRYCIFDSTQHDATHNSNDDDDDEKAVILQDRDGTKPQILNILQRRNTPPTFTQCMNRFNHIPVINDHVPNSHKTDIEHKQHHDNYMNEQLPSQIHLKRHRSLTAVGHCLALEELFSLLCWKHCHNLAIKIQFSDVITMQNCNQLILKYKKHFGFENLSCIWYHGVFLHQFPIINHIRNRHKMKKLDSIQTNYLSFNTFVANVKQIPSITYSLSWPTNHMAAVKSAEQLKLCLSSVLSEISMDHEHDIIIHFPIQHIYDTYYILNDLITNKSYFPYVAFNFFNRHNNLHNFDFSEYYRLKYGQNGHIPKLQNSTSSWNIFGFSKKHKHSDSQLPYDTDIADIKNLKQDQIVCKSDLNWLSFHIHQMFSFTSISCVRLQTSPNDEFKTLLAKHDVPEWSGRLSWNQKSNKHKKGYKRSHRRPQSFHALSRSKGDKEIRKQREIEWKLWQLARIDSKSRSFHSCIHQKNIGLAPRNNGWLITTRELKPPYRIKGRFFTANKYGVMSIYIRCSSIEYPAHNDVPAFGIGIHIGHEKLKIVTHRMHSKPITHQCGIGATIDNGYNFHVLDRGVMYPISCQVERTGKDGKGDGFPKGINAQIQYPKDSTHWLYHVVFVNSSSEWVIVDRLLVDEKK